MQHVLGVVLETQTLANNTAEINKAEPSDDQEF
jgi:hypothetical protein